LSEARFAMSHVRIGQEECGPVTFVLPRPVPSFTGQVCRSGHRMPGRERNSGGL